MATDFKVFAGGVGANALTPAAYAALTTLLSQGFQTGTASSQQVNTVWRQCSTVAAAIGLAISDGGFNAVDDGNAANLKAAFLSMLDTRYAPLAAFPSGTVVDFAGETPPTGWLECNGASLLRAGAYAALFTAIGTLHGAVDGTHFNIPDHRGKFKRGWAHGTSNDPDRATRTAAATGGVAGDRVGSIAGWTVESHTHDTRLSGSGVNYNGAGGNPVAERTGVLGAWLTAATGGNQTAPINAYVMSIIKI